MSDEFEEGASERAKERIQSKKIEVIEIVFDRLMGKDTWPTGRRMIVDSALLVEAIKERNLRNGGKELSTGNPANFLKDFIRTRSCNVNWPARLSKQRVTARRIPAVRAALRAEGERRKS